MDSCHGNLSPSDPMESVCRHFPPPPQLYLAVYLLSLSRTVSGRSDGLLPRQPVSIGSDGVRLPTFSTPSSAILCCIFTKSLANCLPMSLVAHGLLPSDSVWLYWTTLLMFPMFQPFQTRYLTVTLECHRITLTQMFGNC